MRIAGAPYSEIAFFTASSESAIKAQGTVLFAFTASAVINTNNVTGSGTVLKFNILDSAGKYLDQKLSEVITGTQDWTRVVVTLSEAEAITINSNAKRFRITVGTMGATNTVLKKPLLSMTT